MNPPPPKPDIVIGYGALERFEECYEFDGNACHIADSAENLRRYLANAGLPAKSYRLVPATFADFLKDFGGSGGEYAMEPQALARFEQAAKTQGLKYEIEEYTDEGELDPKIFIVRFGGWQRADDEALDDEEEW